MLLLCMPCQAEAWLRYGKQPGYSFPQLQTSWQPLLPFQHSSATQRSEKCDQTPTTPF